MIWLGWFDCEQRFEGFDLESRSTWSLDGGISPGFSTESPYGKEAKALVKNKQVIPFILASNEGEKHA